MVFGQNASRDARGGLELEIQELWDKANAVLGSAVADISQIRALAAAVRDCARRARAGGLIGGERELLRIAQELESRLDDKAKDDLTPHS